MSNILKWATGDIQLPPNRPGTVIGEWAIHNWALWSWQTTGPGYEEGQEIRYWKYELNIAQAGLVTGGVIGLIWLLKR